LRYASSESGSIVGRNNRSRRRGTFEDRGRPGASVGDTVRFSKAITEADVETFARLSGDENPIHLDESYAEQTRFGRRIVHGALATGLVSAALARLPGLVIYLSQDTRFTAPVEVGETVSIVCEIVADLGHGRYRLTTEGCGEDGESVLSGEAVVMIEPEPA
jgi:3-hydroxybutyryl-CoA dehydratase